jgi:hypothetical protein
VGSAPLAQGADPAGDVAGHPFGALEGGQRHVLAQRPEVKRRVRGENADGEAVADCDYERLEHAGGVKAERGGGLQRV